MSAEADDIIFALGTNPTTASYFNPEDHFSIVSSTDLKTWTVVTNVNSGIPGSVHVWVPEWYVEGGVARVLANIDIGEKKNFRPYIFTAENSSLTSWSGPVDMGIGAPGKNRIDTVMVKSGGTYHVFTKENYTLHATSSSKTGPWTWVGTGDWAGWGNELEGPSIVKVGSTWRIFMDPMHAPG